MRRTLIALLALSLFSVALPTVAAQPEPDPDVDVGLEECLNELLYWPPPSNPDTICGKVAQIYWDVTQPTAQSADATGYVEECLSEFTWPAPTNPSTVCGKVAQIYWDVTQPTAQSAEVCLHHFVDSDIYFCVDENVDVDPSVEVACNDLPLDQCRPDGCEPGGMIPLDEQACLIRF